MSHGSKDYFIVPDTVIVMFNLDIESTYKTLSIANNLGRALVKKKVLMQGSKKTDTINIIGIYDNFKDSYMSKKT